MKKQLISLWMLVVMLLPATEIQARELEIYVSDQFLRRDIHSVQGFDMLPVLDIAGELGYQCYYDGSQIQLYNNWQTFVFTMGSASVYDLAGNWYGLDVVPQVIGGSVCIPAKFFQDVFGMSYVWDSRSDSLFLNSEWSYERVPYERTLCGTEYIYPGQEASVVLCNEAITLRAQPSTNAAALGMIPLYSTVTFRKDMYNGFFKVSYLGRTGYVLASYLDYFEPNVLDYSCRVVNCRQSISLRTAASTSAEVIAQIPLGATVMKTWANPVNGFWLVYYNGYTGWALSNYLQKI